MRRTGLALLWAWLLCAAAVASPMENADRRLERLVADYTGLYARDTLAQWKTLFLPGFSSMSSNADGSVSARELEDFYAAQADGFAGSASMGERLENVRIERHGVLASVWADFVFWADGPPARGRLVLLAVDQPGGWRFYSLMFSYGD